MPNPSSISKAQIDIWEKAGIVHYLGQVEDVREFIASACCVVLPSYREGAPRVLLEAMAMGKPIITTNAIGCKDLVLEGINGFSCKVKDTHSLAKAMRSMLELKEQEYTKMCLEARAFAKTHHNVAHIIEIYRHASLLI